ncbi:hypothetical protein [Marinobacter sp.]|jgi:hypothetical protein|nr:hypothetical protein [Marinobacter sp.]MBC7191412.1 hypothetical protein [Marinobacter sp.]
MPPTVESVGSASGPDNYFRIIDRLREHLLESGDEKKRAASRYLEFARL